MLQFSADIAVYNFTIFHKKRVGEREGTKKGGTNKQLFDGHIFGTWLLIANQKKALNYTHFI